jgi:Ni,Fe-hydrogenase III small subunit
MQTEGSRTIDKLLKPPFSKAKKPAPEKRSKRARATIIAADSSIFMLIEEAVKEKCAIRTFKCVSDSEQAIKLIKDEVDLVIFGPLYQQNISDVVREIRQLHPKAKIIKLAGTDEYKKITSEHSVVSRQDQIIEYDAIIPFCNLKGLSEVIEKLGF